ncbi:sugar-binding transcriptional regulator [Hoeflea prorocentri]|uniref:Sugar-binding domain-containing protein n=1 Tax=Hoeflea prorocentri TaxID=1922333 RepID=A0A9X3ZI92_9HYPH|nr:sugar-binding domain-containing protein [Hoeflea prorocentri]MCY6381763.1 hypothetical protein [Hoeflea prorocentri]MDA5399563.1 hypothetical protein [Hoeflea prorocentri]
MSRNGSNPRSGGDKDALLSNVALLYYGEGLTQGEIAKRMQVSRATIVNMLRESRERGIVDIRVDGRHLSNSSLSRELKEKFALEDVYVSRSVSAAGKRGRAADLPLLARVAASAVRDIVKPGDRIGVAWGETIMAVSNVMASSPVEGAEVCQLIGSMISERVPASEFCAIQIANRLDARCFTLHAPGIVSSDELAGMMRQEPTIKSQLDRLTSLDVTIASVGHVGNDTHFQVAGMATLEEIELARQAGAVGILCCRYLDRDGRQMDLAPSSRLIAAELEQIRHAPKKLLAVCGRDRAEPTLAAIRGGLVTHLCVDEALANELMTAGD